MTERNPGQPPTQDRPPSREDRPPEVRRYLDALGAEIRDRQKKFGIATREDARRVAAEHTDLDGLEELARLMERFRTVFEANTMTEGEREWANSVETVARAGEAFDSFARLFDEAKDVDKELSIVRAAARAGEPRLAWNLYESGSDVYDHLPICLGALVVIWESFTDAGKTPPFTLESIAAAFIDSNRVDGEFVEFLCRHGASLEVVKKAIRKIRNASDNFKTLLFVRQWYPNDPAIEVPLKEAEKQGFLNSPENMSYLVHTRPKAALATYERFKGRSSSVEFAYAIALVQIGEVEDAFIAFTEIRKSEKLHYSSSNDWLNLAIGFLKRAEVGKMTQVIEGMPKDLRNGSDAESWFFQQTHVHSAETVMRGLLSAPEGYDFAMRYARKFLDIKSPTAPAIDSFTKAVSLLAQYRKDVAPLVDGFRKKLSTLSPDYRVASEQAMTCLDALLALQTFKDAERAWLKAVNPVLGIRRRREEWDREIGNVVRVRKDLLELVQDNPL